MATAKCKWCGRALYTKSWEANPYCLLYATLDGRECTNQNRYTHCPEHGCKLEPSGECLGCSGGLSEEDYPLFHD